MMKSARLPGLTILSVCLFAVIGMADISLAVTPHVNAGGNHTAALKSDGTIWAWGENTFGQLGDGSLISRKVPVKIGTDTNWTAVAAGFFHAAALKSDGSLWTWGDNTKGQLGDGGIAASSAVPTRVGIATDWAAIAAGDFHTLALKTDGSLWAWGDNASGQTGNGAVVPGIQPIPVRIGTDSDWVAIAAGGSHSIALKANHTLWAWGSNAAGQLGNGTGIDAVAPVPVSLPAPFINNDWNAVAAGQSHSVALKLDGTLWSWGSNGFGQLGNSTILNSNVPVRETGGATSWVGVSAGDFHTVGRRSDGTLWAWGGNARGQLGNGTNSDALAPQKIGVDSDWVESDAGSVHTVALKANGTVWGWGDNASGQVGDGTNNQKNSPTPVLFSPPPATDVTMVTDKSSPQMTATPGGVTFTVTGQGGSGSYEYQFWFNSGTGWILARDYSAANSWNWVTVAVAPGSYDIQVNVRNAGSGTLPYEAATHLNYVLTQSAVAADVTLTAAPASPQAAGPTVTFTAGGVGGTGSYEYQFWLNSGAGWTMGRDYSGTNTWNWSTAGLAVGTYAVQVNVRSAGSTVLPYEAARILNFVITLPAATDVAISASPSTPLAAGPTVTFTAAGVGGTGSYEYQFWINNGSGWTLVRNYLTTNTWNWNTAGLAAGTYVIQVNVRSAGSRFFPMKLPMHIAL